MACYGDSFTCSTYEETLSVCRCQACSVSHYHIQSPETDLVNASEGNILLVRQHTGLESYVFGSHSYILYIIQCVPGGMYQTSGGCSLW
jgi:hypothetical protein